MTAILASKKSSSDCTYCIGIESRLSPGYEVSFGRSLARVGLLGAENNCYISHYHIISYNCTTYHIILSYHITSSYYIVILYVYIYMYIATYIYIYMYIATYILHICMSLFESTLLSFCNPQSKLHLPTLRQGSRERKNATEQIKNMTLARI